MEDNIQKLNTYNPGDVGTVDALIMQEDGLITSLTLTVKLVFFAPEVSYLVLVSPPHNTRYIFLDVADMYLDDKKELAVSTSNAIYAPFQGGLNLFEDTLYKTFELQPPKSFSPFFYRSQGTSYIMGSHAFRKAFNAL